MAGPTYGYRDGEAKIFDLAPGEALPVGWFDSPAKVEARPPAPAEIATPETEIATHDAEIATLREKAEALGIDVDNRWGVKRLKAEIAAKETGDE